MMAIGEHYKFVRMDFVNDTNLTCTYNFSFVPAVLGNPGNSISNLGGTHYPLPLKLFGT